MPDFQFNILKNNAERFNINIIDDDLNSIDGLINGILKLDIAMNSFLNNLQDREKKLLLEL